MPSADSGETRPRAVKFLDKTPAAAPVAGSPAPDPVAVSRPRRIKFLSRGTEGTDAGNAANCSYRGSGSPSVSSAAQGASSVPQIRYQLEAGSWVRVTPTAELCEQLIAHCSESNRHGKEVGGVLVGLRTTCPGPDGTAEYTIDVTDIIPVTQCSNSPSHVQFDQAFWDRVDEEMNSRHAPAGKCRVGWYHTHPHQGIFFSSLDKDAHTIFRQPYQCAFVVDPRNMDAGLFYWHNRETRTLAGPIRFSLVPSTRQRPSARIFPAVDPKGPNWFAVAGAGVCVALVLGGLVSRGTRFSLLDATLLGVAAVIGGYVTFREIYGAPRGIRRFVDARVRDALSVAALAGLTFWSGARLTMPSTGQPSVATATVGSSGSVQRDATTTLPSQAARAGKIAAAPASPSGSVQGASQARVNFVVDQSRKGKIRRVIIETSQARASIAYQLRRCRQSAGQLNVGTCAIQVDRRRERRFVNAVCSGGGSADECVRQMQRNLGFAGAGADGVWGPQTRIRFLREAIRTREPRVLGTGVQMVFERKMPAARRASRRAGLRVRFVDAG